MDEGPTPPPAPDRATGRATGRGVLTFVGVLLLVLVVIVIGARTELTQSFGLSGEAGTFTAAGCGRNLQYDGTTARAKCVGEVQPDDGGEAFAAQLFHDGDAGETYRVRADPESGDAYLTSFRARWAAVALPLAPLPFLWLTVGWWWAMRRPGLLSRGERVVLVGVWAVPSAVLLLVCVVGFALAVLTS